MTTGEKLRIWAQEKPHLSAAIHDSTTGKYLGSFDQEDSRKLKALSDGVGDWLDRLVDEDDATEEQSALAIEAWDAMVKAHKEITQ